jgi:hypothetical protein
LKARHLFEKGDKMVKWTTVQPFLTENLDQFHLMPETTFRNKFLLTMGLPMNRDRANSLVFFQSLCDKNPEGKFDSKLDHHSFPIPSH